MYIPHKSKNKNSDVTPDQVFGIIRSALSVLLILGLPAVAVVGVFILLRPYFDMIVLAVLIATIFSPIHFWIYKRVKSRKNIAALLAVALVTVGVITPFSIAGMVIVKEVYASVNGMVSWMKAERKELDKEAAEESATKSATFDLVNESKLKDGNITDIKIEGEIANPKVDKDEIVDDKVEEKEKKKPENMHQLLSIVLRNPIIKKLNTQADEMFGEPLFEEEQLTNKVIEASGNLLTYLSTQILPFAKATSSFIIKIFLMLFVMFYTFRDGRKFLKYLHRLVPLKATQQSQIVNKIKEVSKAVFVGIFLTSFIQSLVAMFAFAIVGIPSFILWGIVLGIFAVIPIVGTAFVWVPATIYLFATGHPYGAIFLILWSVLVINSVDNIVRPLFMGEKLGMPYIIILFSLLGGIQTFGPIGLVYGPLIFSLCVVCLYIYEMENKEYLKGLSKQ